MKHSMRLQEKPFQMIKSGVKTIELRLYDEKRKAIHKGDEIVFTCTKDGQTLRCAVVDMHVFNFFAELYQALPLLQCGYTHENVKFANPSDMNLYYSAELQKKYDALGIELRLI